MDKLAHTPGPWIVRDLCDSEESGVYIDAESPNYGFVARVSGTNLAEANACLIAAAPDMLLVCEELQDLIFDENGDVKEGVPLGQLVELARIARGTVEKARGADNGV